MNTNIVRCLIFVACVVALSSCTTWGGVNCSAIKSIPLSSISEYRETGFTCTGLCVDSINHRFFVGNIGILKPEDSEIMKSTIVILSEDFSTKLSELRLYEVYPHLKDIQGIAYNYDDETLWFCSFSENRVYNINTDGTLIESYEISKPTGIAYDSSRRCIWILTYTKLLQLDEMGAINISYDINVEGQDQLCYDSENDKLLMTAGLNYDGTNYVYQINPQDGHLVLLYNLVDSYAVEGIALMGGNMYIANDGLYHNAKIPQNLVNIYNYECKR